MSAPLFCAFCGKRSDEVRILVAGPGAICICNECVDLCVDIVAAHSTDADATTSFHTDQEKPMPRTPEERETALACLKIAMEKAEFATCSQEIVDTAARFYEFVTSRTVRLSAERSDNA